MGRLKGHVMEFYVVTNFFLGIHDKKTVPHDPRYYWKKIFIIKWIQKTFPHTPVSDNVDVRCTHCGILYIQVDGHFLIFFL